MSTKSKPVLSAKGLSFSYGKNQVVSNLDIEVFDSEIFCILGPSGCGKSTLLRLLAGLEAPSSGSIEFKNASEKSQSIGYVFQEYALFPHLSIEQNIEYGIHDWDAEKKKNRTAELAELFDVKDLLAKYPSQISGGQAQRVAIARSLAPEPKILLMDEPFSNLDAQQKKRIKPELLARLRKTGVPTIMVTHDQEEAFDIGDRIAVMHQGKFMQVAPSFDLYHQPACRFVAEFVGVGSFIAAKVAGDQIETALGSFPISSSEVNTKSGAAVELFVRPEDLVHDDSADCLQAKVISRQFRGAHSIFMLKLDSGEDVYSLAPSHHIHKAGDSFAVRVELEHVLLFPKT